MFASIPAALVADTTINGIHNIPRSARIHITLHARQCVLKYAAYLHFTYRQQCNELARGNCNKSGVYR